MSVTTKLLFLIIEFSNSAFFSESVSGLFLVTWIIPLPMTATLAEESFVLRKTIL